MSATRIVNVRLAHYDFYCGRAGRGEKGTFGNPYTINPGQTRGATIEKFREFFEFKLKEDTKFFDEVVKVIERKRRQKGELTLGCFCAGSEGLTVKNKPFTCHAQVIAEYIDKRCP